MCISSPNWFCYFFHLDKGILFTAIQFAKDQSRAVAVSTVSLHISGCTCAFQLELQVNHVFFVGNFIALYRIQVYGSKSDLTYDNVKPLLFISLVVDIVLHQYASGKILAVLNH